MMRRHILSALRLAVVSVLALAGLLIALYLLWFVSVIVLGIR